MPFNQKPQKFNAKINTVTVGTGDKAVTIGGNSTFPFYTFDAPTENRPKIGVEITDMIGDETVATDPDVLVAFLTEHNHPALSMDPMM